MDAPIIIVSYGADRTLNRQKVNMSVDECVKKRWNENYSFSNNMKMNHTSIVIINPMDEKAHTIGTSNVLVKY